MNKKEYQEFRKQVAKIPDEYKEFVLYLSRKTYEFHKLLLSPTVLICIVDEKIYLRNGKVITNEMS